MTVFSIKSHVFIRWISGYIFSPLPYHTYRCRTIYLPYHLHNPVSLSIFSILMANSISFYGIMVEGDKFYLGNSDKFLFYWSQSWASIFLKLMALTYNKVRQMRRTKFQESSNNKISPKKKGAKWKFFYSNFISWPILLDSTFLSLRPLR